MEDKKHIRTLGLVLVLLMLAACGTINGPKDTPYDPKFPEQTLFDQIPNNEGGANTVCAGDIDPRKRLPHQSGRC